MRRRIRFGLIVILTISIIFLLTRESFYAKQTYGEMVWHTLGYGVENQLAQASRILNKEQSFLLEVPLYKQENRLTCEVAALRMALAWHDVNVSEDELLSRLTFSTHDPIENGIWGDPELGFVGNPNGSLTRGTGYGVYESPIRDLARLYGRPTAILENTEIYAITNLVSSGKPIIVWMDIDWLIHPIYWLTYSGEEIKAHPGEHTRVVVGFIGDPYSPSRIILNDPIYGKVTISTEQFLKEWEALGRRALVVN